MTTLLTPGAAPETAGAETQALSIGSTALTNGARGRRAEPRPERAPIRPGGGHEALSFVSSAFTMIALICLWFVLQVLVLSGYSAERDQQLLYAQLRTELAEATAPTGPVVPAGDPVALLSIPRLGLQQVVVEGTASGDLFAGPGHRRDTVLPGQQGVSVVYGKASTYGKPFADLERLRPGDRVITQTAQGETEFKVDGIRRAGDSLAALPAGAARLTLVTAQGQGRLGALRPGETVYVDATAAQAMPVPAGRPTAIPEAEKPMAGDTSALPMLALALAALGALTLGIVTARQRWSGALVWVIATPVVIALAWFSTDTVMRLLPNLM